MFFQWPIAIDACNEIVVMKLTIAIVFLKYRKTVSVTKKNWSYHYWKIEVIKKIKLKLLKNKLLKNSYYRDRFIRFLFLINVNKYT